MQIAVVNMQESRHDDGNEDEINEDTAVVSDGSGNDNIDDEHDDHNGRPLLSVLPFCLSKFPLGSVFHVHTAFNRLYKGPLQVFVSFAMSHWLGAWLCIQE